MTVGFGATVSTGEPASLSVVSGGAETSKFLGCGGGGADLGEQYALGTCHTQTRYQDSHSKHVFSKLVSTARAGA